MDEGGRANDTAAKREQLRIDFYATYDVMTGVRIAATLGAFFGLMVFLVVYKSRSKSMKALNDPKIAEIAAAAVAEEEAEEEERQLTYALEAALGARCSLAGPMLQTRFSSVGGGGGYATLLAPPIRGDSLPTPSLHLLAVPRRFSNITCSSSGSSYLERRGSSLVCTLPIMPRTRRTSNAHIDIKVIQATPELSPCVSERTIGGAAAAAPLASLECHDCDLHSLGSDSVFADGDTDDEVEPFSTDSDASDVDDVEETRQLRPRRRSRHRVVGRSTCSTISAALESRDVELGADVPVGDSVRAQPNVPRSQETLF